MKVCRDCGELKPLDAFPRSVRGRNGRATYCQPCMNVRSSRSRIKRRAAQGRPVQPRRIVPEGQRWCPDCSTAKDLTEFPRNKGARSGYGGYCKPCHNARGQETRQRLHGGGREYHLRSRYGIGQADVDRMLADQGGVCAACGKPDPEHVDHDHKSGVVRGMLCFNCNQALGNVRDSRLVLEQLSDYLLSASGVDLTTRCHETRVRGFEVEFASDFSMSG